MFRFCFIARTINRVDYKKCKIARNLKDPIDKEQNPNEKSASENWETRTNVDNLKVVRMAIMQHKLKSWYKA